MEMHPQTWAGMITLAVGGRVTHSRRPEDSGRTKKDIRSDDERLV